MRQKPASWEDISDVLTHDGLLAAQSGALKVLTFKQPDGTQQSYRIMRATKFKCWAKKTKLYRMDEVDIIDKKPLGNKRELV